MAGPFPCDRVDLLSYLPAESMGVTVGLASGDSLVYAVGDLWGWTYQDREFALVTSTGSLSFVEVTDPENPTYVGYMQWCDTCSPTLEMSAVPDVVVYRDVVYRTWGESRPSFASVFGMDLQRVASLSGSACVGGEEREGICFLPDVNMIGGVTRTLLDPANLAVNQESGFLYATNAIIEGPTFPDRRDLVFVDLSDPVDPVVVGSYDDPDPKVEGHEVQCVMYRGPDLDHAGKEVCFLSAGSAIQIIDVTDKLDPVLLGSASPAEIGFLHQGWLTTDHAHFFVADAARQGNTRMMIWDVTDLDNPQVLAFHDGPTMASANTVYIDENLVFLSAFEDGIRVFDIGNNVADPTELGWFGTPVLRGCGDGDCLCGAWTAYPYFASGNVIAGGGCWNGESRALGPGFFVLRPTAAPVTIDEEIVPQRFDLSQNYPNPFNRTTEITFSLLLSGETRIVVHDALGRQVSQLIDQHLPAGVHTVTWEAVGLPSGIYVYRLATASGVRSRMATLLR